MAPSGPGGLLARRRLLGTLIAGGVTMLVGASVIGFSGAYFTSTSSSPDNEFAAAGMGLTLDVPDEIVDGAGMRPGDVRTGDQSVTNTGHRGLLVLEGKDIDRTQPLSRVLTVTIRQTAPSAAAPVYDGPLSDLRAVELGTLTKDERRSYRFTVTWPAGSGSPALDGTSTSLRFDWQLESVP
jgi:hypothetical protein